MWRTIYLSKLPRFEKKLRVALDWTLDLLFTKDLVQFQTFRAPIISHVDDGSDAWLASIRSGYCFSGGYVMIRFGEDVCRNLDSALRREWLKTNGIGGFASSTINGCNTRQYTGLWSLRPSR
jgi:hypothetical protein